MKKRYCVRDLPNEGTEVWLVMSLSSGEVKLRVKYECGRFWDVTSGLRVNPTKGDYWYA